MRSRAKRPARSACSRCVLVPRASVSGQERLRYRKFRIPIAAYPRPRRMTSARTTQRSEAGIKASRVISQQLAPRERVEQPKLCNKGGMEGPFDAYWIYIGSRSGRCKGRFVRAPNQIGGSIRGREIDSASIIVCITTNRFVGRCSRTINAPLHATSTIEPRS